MHSRSRGHHQRRRGTREPKRRRPLLTMCGRFTHRYTWADIHRLYRLTSLSTQRVMSSSSAASSSCGGGGKRIVVNKPQCWPTLSQSLLGFQCEPRPRVCHVRQSGTDSRIRRVRRHPLTVSSAQSAFKRSKHRQCPKEEGRSIQTGHRRVLSRSKPPYCTPPHRGRANNLTRPSVGYSTQCKEYFLI
jgi:hypothetical protein